MLLPIGHDVAGVRRLPWMTFLLMAACLMAFLCTHAENRRGWREYVQRHREALQYFREHPRLHLPGEFERLVPR